MAGETTENFEHQVLEADIKRLALEVQKHRENTETKPLSGPELIKKSLRTMAPVTAPVPPVSSSPLPSYTDKAPAEAKLEIEYLLDIAFHKGIEKANSEARKSSPFIIDAFHDALTTKLYPELQKRGIVK